MKAGDWIHIQQGGWRVLFRVTEYVAEKDAFRVELFGDWSGPVPEFVCADDPSVTNLSGRPLESKST